MVKHNNVVPNVHFHKKWALRVKTWFDQPGRKASRRYARAAKAAKVFPRPVDGLLRPVVHCMTQRYNSKQRFGRGFTFEEIKVRRPSLTISLITLYYPTTESNSTYNTKQAITTTLQPPLQRSQSYPKLLMTRIICFHYEAAP
jgi:hypothetical protein